MKNDKKIICFFLLLITNFIFSQTWSLKLKSTVELRTYKLTNKADISVDKLGGASITLTKAGAVVLQTQSDGGGDFIIDIPANGEYVLTVSYPGCNAKKFAISTLGVPESVANDKFFPTFGIEGVIMAKPFPTINYSVLQQPLVKIGYVDKGKKFDDFQSYTNQILGELLKINEAENTLIENFTSTNNTGDIALSKGNCPLAKSSYEKAMTIISGEKYPIDQLPKVGDCLKSKEIESKKAADELLAKTNEAKLAAEKSETERLAKEKAIAEKIENEKIAKQKLEMEKLNNNKISNEKIEAEKIAKEKLAAQKAENERMAKEKLNETKKNEAPPIKTKTEEQKVVKTTTVSAIVESNNGIKPSNSSSNSESNAVNNGDSKFSIPQALGADKYKATMKRADELFKMKRYTEAKPIYEEALKQKPNDPAATSKLEQIEKVIKK